MTRPRKARLWCAGCGHEAGALEQEPFPFRCRQALPGDDIDHVMRRTVHVSAWRKQPVSYGTRHDAGLPTLPLVPHVPADDDELALLFDGPPPGIPHPFLRYRRRLYSYHVARASRLPDVEYAALVGELDERLEQVEGHGFVVTPISAHAELAARLRMDPAGAVLVKDETNNVSGSHKARHLFGLLLYQRVVETLLSRGLVSEDAPGVAHILAASAAPLAIASCGNAALAAAVIARAADRALDVFIPPWANARVVEQLRDLGAQITVCERRPGETGDPCQRRFREAVEAGAAPFCCQGPDNGLTIEGGETLVFEMLDATDAPVDRVFVQVGGGALASSCARAFEEALAAGFLERLPRLHAVQTEGGWPLARAYDRVVTRLLARVHHGPLPADRPLTLAERRGAATVIAEHGDPALVREAIRYAARHRSEFMWPWEPEPRSIAHGILDDETYDWLAVIEGMLTTGGWPVVVTEDDLARANTIGREATGIDVDHTGTAGLAGLVRMLDVDGGASDLRRERVTVLFTGRRR